MTIKIAQRKSGGAARRFLLPTARTVFLACILMGVQLQAAMAEPEEQGQAEASDASAEAQANNPLANMKAFNLQNYYIGKLTESDEDANQFVVRYAQPISIGDTSWLMRASLPINTFPTPPNGSKETGLGDFNIFAAYLFDTGNPGISVGLGPQLTIPTATDDDLGSEQWSAGLAQVTFVATSPVFQYGYLLTWQASFAGEDDRDDVNIAVMQPFAFFQLGDGIYLRAAPLWVYNFEKDYYSVPMGVGIGKVIKKGTTVYNLFIEPQYSVADDGPGQPQWQIFFALNMQFLGG
ncbi:hypothetical protein [Desulfoluna spongiiphila]|uniref:hypothetical protein n=1 Tax=Desulfoluna spongiiphila TaxID=419481 RepID=UPI0012551E96|nr:hypothetical protein [Desulfoluna spongiiphila]VVS92604.1 hypothetical protein DBB_21720 [Desulfoluna spongiiphila]